MVAILERAPETGSVTVIVGTQSGDEGKGRFTDLEASNHGVVGKYNGSHNAGHTVVVEGTDTVLDLHILPSGIAHKKVLNLLGPGVLVDPEKWVAEKQAVEKKLGRKITPAQLMVSSQVQLEQPGHIVRDELREKGKKAQGSTKSGVAFVMSDKALRTGVRAEDIELGNFDKLYDVALNGLVRAARERSWWQRIVHRMPMRKLEDKASRWVESSKQLRPFVGDTVKALHEKLEAGVDVLAEGAQAHWLDPNHGKWPDVTSTDTTVGGALSGLGFGAHYIGRVVGVAKLTKSIVGGSHCITEITDEEIALRVRGKEGEVDAEYGTTTGRPRKVGYFDLVEIRNAIRVSGITELVISKLDCADRFGETMKVAVAYKNKKTGEETKYAPTSVETLQDYEAVYREFSTWSNISNIREFKGLPQNAKDFVNFVSEELGVKVSMLGVGYKHDEVIVREELKAA